MTLWNKFASKVGIPTGPDVIRHSDGENIGPCIPWIGKFYKDGYGKYSLHSCGGGRAHRVMWKYHFGDAGKLHVLHHCDNPVCVNIKHLWIGTDDDNRRDMMAKGRHARGDTHGARLKPWTVLRGDAHHFRKHPESHARGEQTNQSSITPEDVVAIRKAFAAGGISQQALADRYGIKQQNISASIRRKNWAHVP